MSLTSLDLGGGGNSFPFDVIGASVTGKIISLAEVQQTDMDSGQPAVWENGQPKMMVAVELATELRDASNPADDGKRTVYLKGSRKSESMSSLAAVLDAVRNASGATTLNVGGVLTLTYAGDGVPSRRGYNAPKQYTATYTAPSIDLSGGAPQAAAQAYPAADVTGVAWQAPQATPAPAFAQPQAAPQPAPAAAPALPPGMTPEAFAAFQAYQAQQAQVAS